jgi:hypothetical protein
MMGTSMWYEAKNGRPQEFARDPAGCIVRKQSPYNPGEM